MRRVLLFQFLRLQGPHLRLGGVKLCLGALQPCLADVLLGRQLALARKFFFCQLCLAARGLYLGCTGLGVLLRRLGVQAHQLLACLYFVARLHQQLHHCAGDLRCHHGVAHGLHHGICTAPAGCCTAGLHCDVGQFSRMGCPHAGQAEQSGTHNPAVPGGREG